MKACKCDRCGKFYLPNYQNTFVVGQWNEVSQWNGLNWEHLNLCKDCKNDLMEWLNEKGDTNESNN
jgi:hypothetical protein